MGITMNAFVVSGLIKRRAQLTGDIEKAHEALRRMLIDLENLDATIRQFEPGFRLEAIKPKAFRPPKAFLKSRDQRKRVEMRFAHLKTHHRFDRMRLRGLSGARDEFLLAATVQNLKTLALRIFQPPPDQRRLALA